MSSSKRKKERRRMRYERNVRKEIEYKKQAWESGKLIEENHNGGPYSGPYSIELGERLYKIIMRYKVQALNEGGNEHFVMRFRLYRMKIRDFILHWNPETPKTEAYLFLKGAIETYWDNPETLLDYAVSNSPEPTQEEIQQWLTKKEELNDTRNSCDL